VDVVYTVCPDLRDSTDDVTIQGRMVTSEPRADRCAAQVTSKVGLVVDTDDALMQVRITGIELGPENRVEEADITDVETLWTRAVDNVAVPVTLHPKDGDADQTRSLRVNVPGDYEFTVDEICVYTLEVYSLCDNPECFGREWR